MERKIAARGFVLGMLVLAAVVLWWPGGSFASAGLRALVSSAFGGDCDPGLLCVVFFDIGQGDSIFIESPTGKEALIDGGPDSTVLRRLSHEMGFFDRDIDYMIPTHPDADHVTGLVSVLARYTVHTIIRTENEGTTDVWHALDTAMESEGADIIYARAGQTYDLGGGASLEILFPDRDVSDVDTNTSSIVARLTYGENSFVFTGDSPQAIERHLVDHYGTQLQSDVLKLGHHGSRTSSSGIFLDTVHPSFAVISAGKNNRYGHPHKETMDALAVRNIPSENTADVGNIVIESDGSHLIYK